MFCQDPNYNHLHEQFVHFGQISSHDAGDPCWMNSSTKLNVSWNVPGHNQTMWNWTKRKMTHESLKFGFEMFNRLTWNNASKTMFGLCIRDNAAMFAWFFVSLDVLSANESFLMLCYRCQVLVNDFAHFRSILLILSNVSDSKLRFFSTFKKEHLSLRLFFWGKSFVERWLVPDISTRQHQTAAFRIPLFEDE